MRLQVESIMLLASLLSYFYSRFGKKYRKAIETIIFHFKTPLQQYIYDIHRQLQTLELLVTFIRKHCQISLYLVFYFLR